MVTWVHLGTPSNLGTLGYTWYEMLLKCVPSLGFLFGCAIFEITKIAFLRFFEFWNIYYCAPYVLNVPFTSSTRYSDLCRSFGIHQVKKKSPPTSSNDTSKYQYEYSLYWNKYLVAKTTVVSRRGVVQYGKVVSWQWPEDEALHDTYWILLGQAGIQVHLINNTGWMQVL
jgi:hypothetical protein